MASFQVDFTNTSSETGSALPDVQLSYTDNLNAVNEASLIFSGSSSLKRDLIEIGSVVSIYRNGTFEFKGIIDDLEYYSGGGMNIHVSGYEIWLKKEKGDYSSSPWKNTASATIATSMIGESSYFSTGTIEAGTDLDFRSSVTSSIWDALMNLTKKTSQDIQIDYANEEIDILDDRGTQTSVETLNEDLQISDVRVSHSYPIGNDVRVYGKSEGNTRVKSDNATYGQDAGSKSTYGIIRKDYVDNSVTTAGEANAMADVLVAQWKDLVKIYEFDVMNPNQELVSGDVITLNSSTKGLSAEEVRIVSIKRGVDNSQEFLTLEVTNKEYSRMRQNTNQKIAELENQTKNLQTYDSYDLEYTNSSTEPTCIGGSIKVCSTGTLTGVLGIVGRSGSCMWFSPAPDGNAYYQVTPSSGTPTHNFSGGDVCFWNKKLRGVATPASNNDAATKFYVDNALGGTLSIAPAAFWLNAPSLAYVLSQSLQNTYAGTVGYFASIELPDGAVITGAVAYGSSNSDSWQVTRINHTGSTSLLASDNMNSEDTEIVTATVDNDTYSYVFYVALAQDEYLYGARINYT